MIVHLMAHYSSFGHSEFIILGGYKVEYIKNYFTNLMNLHSSIYINYESNKIELIRDKTLAWKVTVLDTGVDTLTGKRLSMAEEYVDEEFFLTYGDGLSNVNIDELYREHNKSDAICTITSVNPGSKYGQLTIENSGLITNFTEKPKFHEWINGGFMACNKKIFSYLSINDEMLESNPFSKLVEDKKLNAFKHKGYWECVDTLRDLKMIDEAWANGSCPWELPSYFNSSR
jgi:glucose-1-phosphate cytidylyltransferase